MRLAWTSLLGVLTLWLLVAAAPAGAQSWTERRVLNMTHQGGENEHPSNTMYAMRESLGLGADMLEFDVQPTKDGQLMVQHDASVKRTTGEDRSIYDLTVEEVQKLDAAYNFIPGEGTAQDRPAKDYPLRGVRTGEKPPPLGYTADDFRIPTLEEVLKAFPDVPMNIEIKGRSDQDRQSFLDNADKLVALLKRVPYPPLVVVSFDQPAVDRFHAAMPDIPVAPGITGVVTFLATGMAPPGTQALQVPPKYSGLTIMTPDFVNRAHANNYAVHVWFSGQEESERVYNSMLDMGVDGLMPAKPRALERVLCERGVPRPANNPNHCGGGLAYAADNCKPAIRKVSRVDAKGRVRLRLRRTEDARNFACAGELKLRGGSTAFNLPYGVRDTTATITLAKTVRRAVRRGAVRTTATARVDDAERAVRRKVRLRSAASG